MDSVANEKTFFGHPRGLATLFFTEMWERFSYYGMRALLILFMTDTMRGGMGWNVEDSSAIYGLYTFSVYVLALPGGWIADRLIGKKKAILWGGVVIALGHYTLAVPSIWTYFTGLALVAVGTGLLKPNVSAVVGDLYEGKGARRDAGFLDLLHGHQHWRRARAHTVLAGGRAGELAPRFRTRRHRHDPGGRAVRTRRKSIWPALAT